MSAIVGALTGGGTNTGGSGMGFRAQGAPIMSPVTDEQLLQAQAGVTGGLGQQQRFAQAVNAQNGLQNQSDTFNQMQGVANGTGPNPAQAQLANATGQNVSNQAAMMASQRGAGSNAGMIARQAAQQGANTQQQAAGQGAALQAQQSLGALGQMGGLSTSQANQAANVNNAYAQNNLAAQQNLLGATGAYNNAQVGMQSNINNANAGIAQGVAGQQGNMMQQVGGGLGSVMNLFGGGSGGGGGDMLGGMFGGGTESAGGAADMFEGGGGLLEGGGEMLAAEGGRVPEKADQSTLAGYIQHLFTEGPNVQSNPNAKQPAAPSQKGASDFKKSAGYNNYADGGTVTTQLDPVSGPQSNVGKSFMQSQDELGAPDASSSAQPFKPIGHGGGGGGGGGGGAAGGGGPDLGGLMKQGSGLFKEFGKFGNWINKGMSEFGNGVNEVGSGLGTEEAGAGLGAIGSSGTLVAGGEAVLPVAEAVMVAAKGGKVPALVSPGEQYLPPKDVKKVAKGANPLEVGERIPGKPKVKGNSYANDTVSKQLESGGVVIPNSVMQSKDPAANAAKFVAAVMKKQALKKGK